GSSCSPRSRFAGEGVGGSDGRSTANAKRQALSSPHRGRERQHLVALGADRACRFAFAPPFPPQNPSPPKRGRGERTPESAPAPLARGLCVFRWPQRSVARYNGVTTTPPPRSRCPVDEPRPADDLSVPAPPAGTPPQLTPDTWAVARDRPPGAGGEYP